jgi:PAS domain S-box-containing protein
VASDEGEDQALRAAALKTAESILILRRRAERELAAAHEALERKTEELRQQREWFEVTLASIGDAVITTDTDGRVSYLNPVAETMTGWDAAEAVGQPLERVFHIVNEQTRQPVENPVKKVLQVGKMIGLANHTALISRSGTELAIEDSAAPIRDANGNVCGAVMVFHDVSERRRADRALLEETRILELLNATGTAIAAQLDLQKLVQTMTDSATKLSGAAFGAFFYNVSAPDGKSYLLYTLSGAPREAFERFGMPRNTPIFDPTFRGEGTIRSADITKDPRYGTMAPHRGMPKGHLPVRSYLAAPVVSRSGEVIGGLFLGHPECDVFSARTERLIVGIAAQAAIAIDNARLYEAAQKEILRREQAEAALQETDRRKDEFLATLAHELRNPLAPIRQAALISKTPAATDAQKRWSHDVINRQVNHMALLLDDLLDISRVTRGTLELRTETTELAEVIDAAVETARPSIDSKRHALSIEIPNEPVLLAADPMRLAQVIANLLTNAAKYTDPQGRIRLHAARDAGSITISVTDNGIGIPADALQRVFAMFSQVKSAQDRSDGGLGIGLALAKGLVDLHGGTIEARSPGVGRGSEFIVRLPALTLKTVPPPRVIDCSAAEPIARRRLLIADDNDDAAQSLATLLRMDGHEVTVVSNGREALAAITSTQPEIALLDIGMPDMNGYEVARRLREDPLGRKVTLIAVTGWGQDRDKARAIGAGFDHHFTKPLEPDALLDLLRSIPAEA